MKVVTVVVHVDRRGGARYFTYKKTAVGKQKAFRKIKKHLKKEVEEDTVWKGLKAKTKKKFWEQLRDEIDAAHAATSDEIDDFAPDAWPVGHLIDFSENEEEVEFEEDIAYISSFVTKV